MAKVNLSLRTQDEHLEKAKRIINQLKKSFGEDSVEVSDDFKFWVEITVNETMGYVHHIADSYYLHIFRNGNTIAGSVENKHYDQVDIDINDIDTIYLLG